MKCSSCSAPIRPVVAIDIDGTLGDYHGHIEAFAEDWLGRLRMGEPYDGSESHRDWFTAAFDVDATTFRQIKLAYRQGGMKRTMPQLSNAATLVNSLQREAEVWLTTTRPWDRFDRVDPDSREWLARHGFQYHGLLYSENKMEELAERVDPRRVAFVLDDLTEVLERAARLFPLAGIVKRITPYNCLSEPWPLQVGDLLDARAMAAAHIQDWHLAVHFDNLPTTEH